MNIRRLVLFLSCAVLAASAAHAAPAPSGTGPVSAFTLDNGLRVLMVPDPRATAVDLSAWYPAGVRYERVGTRGISHLFERLSSRGVTPGARRKPGGKPRPAHARGSNSSMAWPSVTIGPRK